MFKRLIVLVLTTLLAFPIVSEAKGSKGSSSSGGSTYVHGYMKKDGTYVEPHYRSAPDSSYNNNWTTSPNVNPYTGEKGTKPPTWNDKSPNDNNYNFGDK